MWASERLPIAASLATPVSYVSLSGRRLSGARLSTALLSGPPASGVLPSSARLSGVLIVSGGLQLAPSASRASALHRASLASINRKDLERIALTLRLVMARASSGLHDRFRITAAPDRG